MISRVWFQKSNGLNGKRKKMEGKEGKGKRNYDFSCLVKKSNGIKWEKKENRRKTSSINLNFSLFPKVGEFEEKRK